LRLLDVLTCGLTLLLCRHDGLTSFSIVVVVPGFARLDDGRRSFPTANRAPAPRRVGTAPSAGGISRYASNVHGMTALA
jgi:hypothetical protein